MGTLHHCFNLLVKSGAISQEEREAAEPYFRKDAKGRPGDPTQRHVQAVMDHREKVREERDSILEQAGVATEAAKKLTAEVAATALPEARAAAEKAPEAPAKPAETPAAPTSPDATAPQIASQEQPALEEAPPLTLESATEETPAPPTTQKAPRTARKLNPVEKAMKSREFRENPTVDNDIISRTKEEYANTLSPPKLVSTKEKGKPRKLELAPGYRVAEWNWYEPFLEDAEARGILHDAIFGGWTGLEEDIHPDGHFDNAAAQFGMTGDEYGQALAAAAMERAKIARQMAAGEGVGDEEQRMRNAEKQTVAFETATEDGKHRITAEELAPGDVLEIDGTDVRVESVDPETGDATLVDGTRFGRQTLVDGDPIWVEKVTSKEGETKTSTHPNPYMPFSVDREGAGKAIAKGIILQHAEAAIEALKRILPNVHTAWVGTRKELEKHLAGSAKFRKDWKRAYQNQNPGATDEQAEKAFGEMLATGLDGKEGFTFKGRTYLITDQVAVRESDGTPANAARRILIHEDAHEGLRHLRDVDEGVDKKWQEFRDAIPADELDTLAKKYTWLQNWRTNAQQHDQLADEWFAARIEEAEKRGKPAPDSLVGKFMQWLGGLIKKLTGQTQTVTDKALLEFMDAARMARFRERAEQTEDGLRFSVADQDGNLSPRSALQANLDNAEAGAEEEDAPTPSQRRDATYMRAVESGDMATAQKIVNEAAEIYESSKAPKTIVVGLDEKPISQETVIAFIRHARSDTRSPANPLQTTQERGRVGGLKAALANALKKDGLTYTEVAPTLVNLESSDRRVVTRDDQGNVIPPSQRFNPENADIRFSVAESGEDEPSTPSRYDLMSPERQQAYEDYQNSPDIPGPLKYLSQFLGNPTSNVRLRQALQPMIEYARSRLGGIWGDSPEVNAENTERVQTMVGEWLTNPDFAGRFRKDFQEDWSPTDEEGRALHAGDAAAAVLQMEVMDYAVRLADQTGDTALMSTLYRFANDMILGDYQTMSGAGRALQTRSMATRNAGIWTALNHTYAAMKKAAVDAVGKAGLETLEKAVSTQANPEVLKDATERVDSDVALGATGKAITEAVQAAEDSATDDYEPGIQWEKVLDQYAGEERANLHAFWQSLAKLSRLLEIQAALDSEGETQVQASKAEDVARYRGTRGTLKAEIEAEMKKTMELLGKVTADESSSVSKETRRKITRDPRAKAAIKAISATKQAKEMIARFENRNKKLKREKPAWRKVFQEQVKSPKGKDEFLKAMQDAGVTEQTSNRLYDVAQEMHKERAARQKPKAAPKAKKGPQTTEEEAQGMVKSAMTEPGAAKPKTALRDLHAQYAGEKISEEQFRQEASKLGVTDETLETLITLTNRAIEDRAAGKENRRAQREATKDVRELEDALKTYEKKITGTYTETRQQQKADLARKLKAGEITQAEHDAEIKSRGLDEKTRLTDTRAFISSVAQQILEATTNEQQDPAWKRQVVINAFRQRGMTQEQAEKAADGLVGIIDRALKEAQAKAAVKVLRKMAKAKKIDAKMFSESIRSQALDPLNPNPVVLALAKQAGYRALTPAQFRELAHLDTVVNESGPHLASKAYAKIETIFSSVRPSKTTSEIVTQMWTNDALASLGVIWLNWVHPIYVALRRLGQDMAMVTVDALSGKTKATEAPAVMTRYIGNWVNAMGGLGAEAKFALKNEAYANRMLEMLTSAHNMMREMRDAAEAIKSGNPMQKVKGAVKWLATSTTLVTRMLASADQAWGGMLQQYIIQNEAMRMLMQKGGLSAEAAATILNVATQDGARAMADYIAKGGDPTEAKLVGIDKMQSELANAVGARLGAKAQEELTETASKESAMELGNRLSEKGANFDFANGLLEMFKRVSSTIRAEHKLWGRVLTGFITIGANILNRSAYFTPLGIARALYKMKSGTATAQGLYAETMATEGQARMRLLEGVAGSLGMILLLLFRKKPEEEGFGFTGEGPDNKSVRDAWMKRGHKPAHLEWVGKDGTVKFSIPYSRGGLDHLAIPLTFVGAMDDMDLNGQKAQAKNASFAWSYGGTMVSNLANQARFFGMKNLVATVPTSLNDKSIASTAAYSAAPLIPWSGLIKSFSRMLTGQQDQTSWNSAVLAQTPIASLFTGQPALNYLGDPVGPQSEDIATKISERLEYGGAPIFVGIDDNSKNADIYRMIVRKGVAPSMPTRGPIEAANGFIADAQWARYVKLRGSKIKEAIRDKMAKIQFMNHDDAAEEMNKISTEATRATKRELNLK